MHDSAMDPPPCSFTDVTDSSDAVRIVAPVSDLMLALQLEGPAREAGYALEIVPDLAALPSVLTQQAPRLAIFDLTDKAIPFADAFALIRRLAPEARTLAFFPHVQRELGATAESAGCDIVMPRSRFLMDLARSLREALGGPTPR